MPYYESYFCDQEKWWQVFHPLILESVVEMRPRQASVLACVVLMRTSEKLAGPRVLEGARCRCSGIEWSCGIVIVKILHSVEGGDIEQVCSNLETNLPCLRLFLSPSLTCIYISCMFILFISLYAWYICFLLLYMLRMFVCSHLYLTKRAIVAPQLLV